MDAAPRPSPSADCWTGSPFSFAQCCYAASSPCFDAEHTFERCCFEDLGEQRASVGAFQAMLPAVGRVASAVPRRRRRPRGCDETGGGCGDAVEPGEPVAGEGRAMQPPRGALGRALAEVSRRLAAPEGALHELLEALLAFLVGKVAWLELDGRERAAAGHVQFGLFNQSEQAAWSRLRQLFQDGVCFGSVLSISGCIGIYVAISRTSGPSPVLDRMLFRHSFGIGRFGIAIDTFGLPPDPGHMNPSLQEGHYAKFEVCSCAGKGYDIYLSAKDLLKSLWLQHHSFPDSLVDVGQGAHHMVIGQSCPDADFTLRTLENIQAYVGQITCAPGEAATHILMAHSCLLRREWQRAAELLLICLALAAAAPWQGCMDARLWDFSAEDVAYNAARLAGAARLEGGLEHPSAAPRLLAWRPSPHRLIPAAPARCTGAASLPGGLCLRGGKLLVPPGAGADLALCTEFGVFERRARALDAGAWASLQAEAVADGRQAFLIPVGNPYPNLWHALHWWVPALAEKRSRGLRREEVRIILAFEGCRADGSPWWLEDGQEEWPKRGDDDDDVMAEFLAFHEPITSVLSAAPPILLHVRPRRPICFPSGVAGTPSFRYDLQAPQVTAQGMELFRAEVAAAAPTSPGALADPGARRPGLVRVLLLQREAEQARWISNLEGVQRVLRGCERSGPRPIRSVVQDMASLPLLAQFALAADSDVLIGAHGAGLAWLVAMPDGAAVLEVMPRSLPRHIVCVESWDHARNLRDGIYGGLARVAGRHHICLTSNESSAEAAAMVPSDEPWVDNFRHRQVEVPLASFARRFREAVAMVAGRARTATAAAV